MILMKTALLPVAAAKRLAREPSPRVVSVIENP
jgi:hypothetical protein